jgi:hypothetical protein
MAKRMRRGQKQCPKCDTWVKGTRAKACPKCGHQFRAKQRKAPVAEAVTAEPEKTAKASATVTLEHVKAVALMVKALGGSTRLNELLGLIKEVGGLKKFKDLLEAISGTNGTAACGVRVYVEAPASSSRRASARGLVNSRWDFGRRFIARGSTRSGRLPTR